jgi:hypothetical protein
MGPWYVTERMSRDAQAFATEEPRQDGEESK